MSRSSRCLWLGAALLGAMALVYHPLWAGRVLAGRDVFRLFIPDASFLLESLRAFDWPLWNPYQRLGQPFAATLQSQAFYPPRLLAVLLAPPVRALTLEHLLHVALAAVGAYRLCRALRASPAAAALGAAAFALGPMLTQLGIQANVVSAAAWTGWLLLGARAVARAPTVRSAAALALPVGLSFLAGSPETLLWQGLLAALLVLPTLRGRPVLLFALGMAWGVGLAAVVGVPGAELAWNARHSDAGDPLNWSTSWLGLLSTGWFLVDLPRGEYWGEDQNFVVLLFLGSLVCALALLGAGSGRRARPFIAGAVGLALLSLGRHFPPAALLLRLPPFSLFRYPAKYSVGAAFCIAVLAALGVDALARHSRRVRPSLARAALALLAAGALFALGVPVVRLLKMRAGAVPGLAWGLAFAGASAAVFLAAGGPHRRLRIRNTVALLGLLELGAAHAVLGMPLWVDARRLAAPSPLAAVIPPPYHGRVSVDLEGDPDETGPEVTRFIERSRPALYPLRFVEEHLRAVEGYGAPMPDRIGDLLRDAPRGAFDLAGVGYFVRREPPFAGLEEVAAPPGLPKLYRSGTALPRAFVLHRARVATDEEALAAIRDPTEPLRRTVYLAGGAPLPGADCESPPVTFAEDSPRRVRLAFEACAEGYLLLSDAHYPGWEAELDGAPAPILRADFLLRAVRVPPGRHALLFRYRPASFAVGGTVSLVSLGLLGLALGKRTARRSGPR